MLTSGQELKLRYEVKTQLGEGGMGTVYQAYDRIEESQCAIKEYRPVGSSQGDDRETVDSPERARQEQIQQEKIQQEKIQQERILSEARILARLKHPNLPRVRDYFPDNGCVYLVMDLVDGEDLDHKFQNSSRPNVNQVIDWSVQVLDALVYCHHQEVIHLDIKPSNIIVNDKGIVYLVDFGIAQYIGVSPNAMSAKQGTRGFSPPEQYQGKPVKQSDIYALGATMYALLTGTNPPPALERTNSDQLKSKLDLVPGITPALTAMVMKALAIDPSDRYETAEGMRNAFLPMTHPWQKAPPANPLHGRDMARRHLPQQILLTWRKGRCVLQDEANRTIKPVMITPYGNNRLCVAWDSGELGIYEENNDRFVLHDQYGLNPLKLGVQVKVLDLATDGVGFFVLARLGSEMKCVLYRIDEQSCLQKTHLHEDLPSDICRMTCLDEVLYFVRMSHVYSCHLHQKLVSTEVKECVEVNAIVASIDLLFVTGRHETSTENQPLYTVWERSRDTYETPWQRVLTVSSKNRFLLALDSRHGHVYAITMKDAGSVMYILHANTGEVLSSYFLRGLHDVEGIAVGSHKVFLLTVKPNEQCVYWYGRQRLVLQPKHQLSSQPAQSQPL